MRHDDPGGSGHGDDFVGKEVGLYRSHPEPVQTRYFFQGTQQVREIFSGGSAEIADIDSGEDDLLKPAIYRFEGFFRYRPYSAITAAPAGIRDGAERAEIVAAILDFQKTAGTVPPG